MFKNTRRLMKIGLVCLTASAAACAPSSEDYASDYLARIENVLNVTESNIPARIIPKYPAPRELKLEIQLHELSIREFLSLRECALHQVIAARNSLIGKVALPSQRLFNDLEILNTGPDCVAKLTNSNRAALAKKLTQFLESKRSVLGKRLWQALLGASENTDFWSVGPEVDNYPNNLNVESLSDILALIEFVNNVKGGRYDYSEQETIAVEKHLGQLRYGDGGRLLFEYAQLVTSLDRTNLAITSRLEQPLCISGKPTSSARYFQNVVNKFFISKVQRHAVLLNRRYEQIISEYLRLEMALAEYAPRRYLVWSEKRQGLMQRGRDAAKEHVGHIQRLFRQCGLTPNATPS